MYYKDERNDGHVRIIDVGGEHGGRVRRYYLSGSAESAPICLCIPASERHFQPLVAKHNRLLGGSGERKKRGKGKWR